LTEHLYIFNVTSQLDNKHKQMNTNSCPANT